MRRTRRVHSGTATDGFLGAARLPARQLMPSRIAECDADRAPIHPAKASDYLTRMSTADPGDRMVCAAGC
jgi:hypothetical protein